MSIFEAHFRRLHARYGAGQTHELQMQEIAAIFGCSVRNCRIALKKMHQEKWLDWQPQRGRGKRSRLHLLTSPEKLFSQNVNKLLEKQDYGNVLRFIGNDKYLLDRLSLWRFGVQDKSSETRVRIPYYRNLDPLNPLVLLRRTERHLLRQCLSGLTRYDAVQGRIVPDIAHYWTHNEDFTRWEFWLKSTARFADGSELDACAVQRCLLAASQSPQFAPLFSPIKTITADRPLNERSLEQGCCFVLPDGDGAFADEAGRRFINYLLQPVELLSQTQLPDEYARILSVAQGMLPQWNHRPVDFGGITAPFTLRQPVIISTFQQPELVELAGAIRRLLERWHIRAEIRIDTFDSFNSQPRPLADIWLSNFMLDTLSVPAFLEWLASTTLFTRLPEAQRRNLNTLLPTILNSDDKKVFATIAAFFHEMTHQRYVIPLLHHWMEFATEKSFTWRDLNTLGWPDFSQLWLE
ncbi:SgrR family transcriptional regulator [Klebsiella michiganensis]|nr:SgrR family transcriptional regulator [Klebsiella michiganensis]